MPVPEKRRFRQFSKAFKLQILKEVDSVAPGVMKTVLKREKLTQRHIQMWREQSQRGFQPLPKGPRLPDDHERLKLEILQLRTQLQGAEASNGIRQQLACQIEKAEAAIQVEISRVVRKFVSQQLEAEKVKDRQIATLHKSFRKKIGKLKIQAVKKLGQSIGIRPACRVLDITYGDYFTTEQMHAADKANSRRQ